MFFFEKKNQKTFDTWRALPERRAPKDKSLLLLFFRKEDLSFHVGSRATAEALPS
jgi:hypothetical protein